jgi:hypothetical protein
VRDFLPSLDKRWPENWLDKSNPGITVTAKCFRIPTLEREEWALSGLEDELPCEDVELLKLQSRK